MSKNTANDSKYYYEIGVFDNESNLLNKYVTDLHIVKGGIVNEKLMSLLKKVHGDDICVLHSVKFGEMPTDIDRIEIEIQEPELQYNK